LDAVTGMVGPTDMVAGAVGGMQRGALGGDILLIHMCLARHPQCMCSQCWLSPLS
jgi:hypothetical protein